jgi:general secretion pathway protein K
MSQNAITPTGRPSALGRTPGRTPSRTPDGFIIVAVLWILGALATLASIYSVYVIDTATAFKAHDDRLQAEGLMWAALELTAHQVTARPEGVRPSNGSFSFRLGNGFASVQFRSEAARIDLNRAPKELLAGLFFGFGARPEDALSYADRIIAWRTKPPPGQDPEASLYQAAGRRYVPRGAPFPHTAELWLVHGLPEAVIERAMPFVTVYSGTPQINVLDAPAEALAALPGMTPDRLHAVLRQRVATPQNGQILLQLLGPAQAHASMEATKTLRVTVQVRFDNGRQLGSEAVIFVGDADAEPYHVLSWRDGFDE